MKVLVEEADEPNGLFFQKFTGKVLAETKDRYLIRHHLIFKEWIPKRNPLVRCMEISRIPYEFNGKELVRKGD